VVGHEGDPEAPRRPGYKHFFLVRTDPATQPSCDMLLHDVGRCTQLVDCRSTNAAIPPSGQFSSLIATVHTDSTTKLGTKLSSSVASVGDVNWA